jgi:hypothetical protein
VSSSAACWVARKADDRRKIRNTQEATEALTQGLEAPYPVLILAEDHSAIPKEIHRVLPKPLRLAPLSRDILMAILAAHNSATGKIDPKVYDLLPPDRDLARLPDASLMFGLRAGTPRAIAARLSELVVGPTPGNTLSLDHIEGYGEAEAVARRMASDLQAWAKGKVDWGDVQRSVLLWGPPGTGKSHLATAMAGSAGATLVRGSFAEWQAKGHLGDMLRAMRSCFAAAAASTPAIIVIDEVDAVGDRGDPMKPFALIYQQPGQEDPIDIHIKNAHAFSSLRRTETARHGARAEYIYAEGGRPEGGRPFRCAYFRSCGTCHPHRERPF